MLEEVKIEGLYHANRSWVVCTTTSPRSFSSVLAEAASLSPHSLLSCYRHPTNHLPTRRSCLLHRFVKDEWRVLTSQTIGVEFASKIIRVGTGARRQRIKLQLWDTAGTERFRSVSRSYYRGAAGAILVYDITSRTSFNALPTFLNDARALASPNLTLLLAGNKADVEVDGEEHLLHEDTIGATTAESIPPTPSTSSGSKTFPVLSTSYPNGSVSSATNLGLGTRQTTTIAPHGREVPISTAHTWASTSSIPVVVEVSAFDGTGVHELFARLARMILTKIELGEIDPDDPASGIQYGDGGGGWDGDGGSVRSGVSGAGTDGGGGVRRRGRRRAGTGAGWGGGMREWEEVFRLDGLGRRRRGGCC